MQNTKTRTLVLISLFAALTAVGAFIKIPTPVVPFTLQFFFCAFSGLLLGAKAAFYSQILYIFIGLAGLPVFTGGGGLMYIFQPTFGYLIGFAFCAYIIGRFTDQAEKFHFLTLFAVIVLGLMIVYVFGVLHLYLILNYYLDKDVSLLQSLWIGFLPYITFDVLQSAVIAYIARRVLPLLRKSGYIQEPRPVTHH